MELLKQINDLTHELGELESEFWERFDRYKIESEMCLSQDDWIADIYYAP